MKVEFTKTGKIFSILVVADDDQEEKMLDPHFLVITKAVLRYFTVLNGLPSGRTMFEGDSFVKDFIEEGTRGS